MRAMVLSKPGGPLTLTEWPQPVPGPDQVLLKVEACGVCRTDLHILDGELPAHLSPVIPGHQIVGRVVAAGPAVKTLALGSRVGVPWLGWTCGLCRFCRRGQENLCAGAEFTGYDRHGGFAEYAVADARYVFGVPEALDPVQVAPLLCAGLIGYRALRMTGNAHRLGLYGFGAAAHIVVQIATHQHRQVYALTRPGDTAAMAFACSLGAVWAGGSDQIPPEPLDAAIVFAPVGALVPNALRALDRGGVVVCAGIYMSDIPSFPYSLLWQERTVRSVANLTRSDGEEFLALAATIPIETQVTRYPLERAQHALDDLRGGRFEGAAVVVPSPASPNALC